QAEDVIRDFHVTGVQTCALPISLLEARLADWLEARWWASPEELVQLAPEAEIGWFDLHEKAPALAAVEAARGLRWLNSSYAGVEIGRASCRERGQRRGRAGCCRG